jgi:hypothetical protein
LVDKYKDNVNGKRTWSKKGHLLQEVTQWNYVTPVKMTRVDTCRNGDKIEKKRSKNGIGYVMRFRFGFG